MSDIHALSGAFAVDALDDLERTRFSAHLTACPACQAEVAGLLETAALLAQASAAPPPDAVRDRVLAGIATVRPLPPRPQTTAAQTAETADSPTADTVTARAGTAPAATGPSGTGPPPAGVPAAAWADRAGSAATPRRRRLALLAAAAAVVLGAGGGVVAWQQLTDDTQQVLSASDRVLQAPDAEETTVRLPGGARATLVRSVSEAQAVLVTDAMPPPPGGKVYQLWLQHPDAGMVSAGLMPQGPDQTVLLAGDAATATAAGITVEPAGGSMAPTSEPIALFDFAELERSA